jgi:hypothetical protein
MEYGVKERKAALYGLTLFGVGCIYVVASSKLRFVS